MKRKRLHFFEKLSIIDQNNRRHIKARKGDLWLFDSEKLG